MKTVVGITVPIIFVQYSRRAQLPSARSILRICWFHHESPSTTDFRTFHSYGDRAGCANFASTAGFLQPATPSVLVASSSGISFRGAADTRMRDRDKICSKYVRHSQPNG